MQIARISQMKKLIAHFSISVSLLAAIGLFIMHAMAVDVPAKPPHYFNDYASLIDPRTAQQLDQRLEDFERQTSNQILIVIYPSLPADAAIEDFTQDAFRAWKPGQQGRDNGAILFVFVKDRKMRIQTGYGLEGALPDAICKRIISDELAPRFQAGDFNGGMTAACSSPASRVLGSGTPSGGWIELIATARRAGVPAVLDTGGEALRLGAAAGPEIIKPNLAELELQSIYLVMKNLKYTPPLGDSIDGLLLTDLRRSIFFCH